MNINLVPCLFVLDQETNDNIRKNDVKKIKLLISKNNTLPSVRFTLEHGLKSLARSCVANIIHSDIFHLEQVFAIGDKKYFDNSIDLIFLCVTNIKNIKDLDDEYQLIDFNISNNNIISFGKDIYEYKTEERISNNNIEYVHNIYVDDVNLEKTLLEVLVSYKRLRTNIDNSDIIFKFMAKEFTLEDVRNVYEMVKDVTVDKSNFRKRIVKYVEKVEQKIDNKGHRPTQLYSFKPLKDDIWL